MSDIDFSQIDWNKIIVSIEEGDLDIIVVAKEFGISVREIIQLMEDSGLPPPSVVWTDKITGTEYTIIGNPLEALGHNPFDYVFNGTDFIFSPVGAAAFTSKATGNWHAEGATTWNEAGHPGTGDTAQINNTHTVTIAQNAEAALSIDVQTGGTLEADSTTGSGIGAAITFTFDDNASAGFGASAGSLVSLGESGKVITWTSTATPPTNAWDVYTTMQTTADYTTFSYFDVFRIDTGGSFDIDNCSFTGSYDGMVRTGGTITSFTNNIIDGTTAHQSLYSNVNYTNFDNISITNNAGPADVKCVNATLEFDNSNLDAANCDCFTTGQLFSDNHNDVASTQVWIGAYSDTLLTSDLTATVGGAGHTLELYPETGAVGTAPIFQLKDNYSIFAIDVKANTELKIDAAGDGASRTVTFDDTASSGFGASAGALTTTGDVSNGVVLTSAATPPTNYWDFYVGAMDLTSDYTTFSCHSRCHLTGTWDVDNCTFDHTNSYAVDIAAGSTVTSFTNNTIDNSTASALYIAVAHDGFDNVVITNPGSSDIEINNVTAQFVNSNLDATNCNCTATGIITSSAHNDVANAFYIIGADNDTVSMTEFTTDPGATDDVYLQAESGASTGVTFQEQGAATYDSMTIGATTIWDMNGQSVALSPSGAGYCLNSAGTITHNNADLTVTDGGNAQIINTNESALYDLTINGSADNRFAIQAHTIDNDFTVGAGCEMSAWSGATDWPLTVTGDVSLSGRYRCDYQSADPTISFGSLTINSGGTCDATSDVTTITSETVGGYAFDNDGTLTPNAGTVTFTYVGTTLIDTAGTAGNFYDLIVNHASLVLTQDTDMTVDHNTTIADGALNTSATNYALVITGTSTVGDGAGAANSASLVLNASTVTLTGAASVNGTDGLITYGSSTTTHTGLLTYNPVFVSGGSGCTVNTNGGLTTGDDWTITAADTWSTVGGGKVITIADGKTATVAGTVTVTGSASSLTTIQSTTSGVTHYFTVTGTDSINYVQVRDSDANLGSSILVPFGIDLGNCVNWVFIDEPEFEPFDSDDFPEVSFVDVDDMFPSVDDTFRLID